VSRFSRACALARNPREPLGRRKLALCRAIESYCSLTRTRFQSVKPQLPDSPSQLASSVELLEAARRGFLQELGRVIVEKQSQRRSPRRAELNAATADVYPRPQLGSGYGLPGRVVAAPSREAPAAAPTPELGVGQLVDVVLNENNRTPHRGTVVAAVWHFERRAFRYTIAEAGRMLKKAYFAADLRRVENRRAKRATTENADGDFYVAADECMACGAPEAEAPELMAHDDTASSCYFVRQPRSAEELSRAIAAVHASCCGAVRYGGDDRLIQARIARFSYDAIDVPLTELVRQRARR
jgi:hypothetical protein